MNDGDDLWGACRRATAASNIKGKALGQPIWNLLGGRFRDRIQVYGHAKTPERARELMARGYKGVKVGFTGAVEIERVVAVREAVGDDVDVMVDAHGPSWMTARDAIIMGRALEPLDILFYEDPIAPENLDALERIRDAVDVPLAAGERVSTLWGIRPYVERDLVDVIQPDTGRAGGITQMRKMAAMAEAHYITMAPHSGSLGPVAEFAALHVMATIPNALMLERVEFDWSGRDTASSAPISIGRAQAQCRDVAQPSKEMSRVSGRTPFIAPWQPLGPTGRSSCDRWCSRSRQASRDRGRSTEQVLSGSSARPAIRHSEAV